MPPVPGSRIFDIRVSFPECRKCLAFSGSSRDSKGSWEGAALFGAVVAFEVRAVHPDRSHLVF
jgi:hypothetical protein